MQKLGFGCMRLPLLDKDDPAKVDLPQLYKMVDTFLERGFTYFDTAYMYHNYQSENFVRQALVERHERGRFTLATKLPTMQLKEQADCQRIFDEQLEKCGVTYFDYYLLHNLNTLHYEMARQFDCFRFIQEKKREGKIRHIGFSFHDNAQLLDEILTAHPEVEFVQLQLNYVDWDNESIQSRKCYEVACKHHKPVIVMEPVKGGTLAQVPEPVQALFRQAHPDWSDASWAIRFAASLENVMVVLSGMSSFEQLEENTGYMGRFQPLQQQDQQVVMEAAELIHRSVAIGCTACRQCEQQCPQHLEIVSWLKEVAKTFEK